MPAGPGRDALPPMPGGLLGHLLGGLLRAAVTGMSRQASDLTATDLSWTLMQCCLPEA